jgi:hypothetical protein
MYRSWFVRYTDVYDIVAKGVGFNVRRISHFEAIEFLAPVIDHLQVTMNKPSLITLQSALTAFRLSKFA